METKYFTPSIEDIRVGYECEVKDFAGNWISHKFESYELGEIRVPYLTKEQIEVEGWKYRESEFSNSRIPFYEKDNYFLVVKELKELSIIRITIMLRDITRQKEPYYTEGSTAILFNGSCPSINEFRYICKLLNIN